VFPDPNNPNGLIASAAGLIYRSSDGGLTWSIVSDDLPPDRILAFTLDPSNPETMFAFLDAVGLFRSDDGGIGWRLILPEQDTSYFSLAIKPGHPDTIYGFNTLRGLVRSLDGGYTFATVGSSIPAQSVTDLLTFAQEPETVFAVALDQVYRSSDSGITWELSSSGLDGVSAVVLSRDARSGLLYVSDRRGSVYISRDGGSSWINSRFG
jgi:photosystem II stability/assembly factor-like uncharacterized protein